MVLSFSENRRWWLAAILENFERPYLCNESSDTLHFQGRPLRDNANAALMFYCCLFLFFFSYSARDLRRLSADRRETLPHDRNWCNFKTRSKIWGPPPKKLGPKNMPFSARFRTTSQFDREYLRNGTRYRQSENGVANYDLYRVRWRNLVNFDPQMAKNRTVV